MYDSAFFYLFIYCTNAATKSFLMFPLRIFGCHAIFWCAKVLFWRSRVQLCQDRNHFPSLNGDNHFLQPSQLIWPWHVVPARFSLHFCSLDHTFIFRAPGTFLWLFYPQFFATGIEWIGVAQSRLVSSFRRPCTCLVVLVFLSSMALKWPLCFLSTWFSAPQRSCIMFPPFVVEFFLHTVFLRTVSLGTLWLLFGIVVFSPSFFPPVSALVTARLWPLRSGIAISIILAIGWLSPFGKYHACCT